MCPDCIMTTAMVFSGATSAGGVSALAVKMIRAKNWAGQILRAPNQRRIRNDNDEDQHRKSESRVES
jgi:hypothetical protein